jgi:hypothetical protein
MDNCSYFIENKALFGSFPSQDEVYELEEMGVILFVDLTVSSEPKLVPYTTNYTILSYPIPDKSIPKNCVEFCKFVYSIYKALTSLGDDEKIYVHCKGGHGRSGIVVAMLLALYHNVSAEEALEMTRKFHQDRRVMRDKWRKIGSPQTIQQRDFVCKMFEPLDTDSELCLIDVKKPRERLLNTYFRKIVSTKYPEALFF